MHTKPVVLNQSWTFYIVLGDYIKNKNKKKMDSRISTPVSTRLALILKAPHFCLP